MRSSTISVDRLQATEAAGRGGDAGDVGDGGLDGGRIEGGLPSWKVTPDRRANSQVAVVDALPGLGQGRDRLAGRIGPDEALDDRGLDQDRGVVRLDGEAGSPGRTGAPIRRMALVARGLLLGHGLVVGLGRWLVGRLGLVLVLGGVLGGLGVGVGVALGVGTRIVIGSATGRGDEGHYQGQHARPTRSVGEVSRCIGCVVLPDGRQVDAFGRTAQRWMDGAASDLVDPVALALDQLRFVGDEQVQRHFGLWSAGRRGSSQDLGPDRPVEGGNGLVEHDDEGAADQGPGDADPLALAAGQGRGEPFGTGPRLRPTSASRLSGPIPGGVGRRLAGSAIRGSATWATAEFDAG